jgi:hypothetical protein
VRPQESKKKGSFAADPLTGKPRIELCRLTPSRRSCIQTAASERSGIPEMREAGPGSDFRGFEANFVQPFRDVRHFGYSSNLSFEFHHSRRERLPNLRGLWCSQLVVVMDFLFARTDERREWQSSC